MTGHRRILKEFPDYELTSTWLDGALIYYVPNDLMGSLMGGKEGPRVYGPETETHKATPPIFERISMFSKLVS